MCFLNILLSSACKKTSTTIMAALRVKIQQCLITAERLLFNSLGISQPPDAYGMAFSGGATTRQTPKFSLDFLKDSFLWAVPKHRRTIYRRRIRRFGSVDGFCKMLQPKTNIVICTECGNDKEAGRLCSVCYERVKEETMAMQETIQKGLGLSPVEREVVVVYQNDQIDKKNEFWKGKRIVEMKKERPAWFSKNLTQSSTQAPATTTAVEPKDLA